MDSVWKQCLDRLQVEFGPEAVQAWLRPLQARLDGDRLMLFAPNAFVRDRVRDAYLARIEVLAGHFVGGDVLVELEVGSARKPAAKAAAKRSAVDFESFLEPRYSFESFVEGKSNELGKATAMQVAQQPGRQFNPLLLYGGTGLGKTHLLHATGILMRERQPGAKVLYLRSEQFVTSMIKALRGNEMDSFKRRFRSLDALLIDDIQFFAGKDRTQEEFFHTFNALLDGKQQIVLTCDRYPKEVEGLQPRLKSRFGWGLSVAIEPPDFETRVAILLSKAQAMGLPLSEEVALLIGKRMRSNVRDLEGALNTLYARVQFSGRVPNVEFALETLRDLLTVHDQQVSLGNIQRVVADYYQIRLNDMLGKRRTRSLARPRQMAMALAKELTDHSLPEIGDNFGGRDHTTVLHACRVIQGLRESEGKLRADWDKLIRAIVG